MGALPRPVGNLGLSGQWKCFQEISQLIGASFGAQFMEIRLGAMWGCEDSSCTSSFHVGCRAVPSSTEEVLSRGHGQSGQGAMKLDADGSFRCRQE